VSPADCVFCGIVAGDVPSQVVHESADALAFRDLNPQAPVHVLVVPRRHIEDAAALSTDDAAVLIEMFTLARQVAEMEGIAERGYRLLFNVGTDASNSVPHLHLHVVGGRRLAWPPG
jgi:histidine triad (HIT) family protein